MPLSHYIAAQKAGKKEIQYRVSHNLPTELPALDNILKDVEISGEVPLGLIDIPTELIVGTKTKSRTNSFAPNFMPLLAPDSEFAGKWIYLCDAHQRDGIREPIRAYEYMNKYYVLEGNKRVSVLKSFGNTSIAGYVTRVIPARKDTKESRIYYEFLDFYNATNINYLQVSRPGNYNHICELVGYRKYERWSVDDRIDFRSAYIHFSKVYEEMGGAKLKTTAGDAIMIYMYLFSYRQLVQEKPAQIKANLKKMWDEITLYESEKPAAVKLEPTPEKKNIISRILPAATEKTAARIAFVHAKCASASRWTYAHDLGRSYVDAAFRGQIKTSVYDGIEDSTQALAAIEQAIRDGNKIIFVTTPEFLHASLKAAVNHPDVRILNCSLNTSHKYIRTYSSRLYEAKFLAGVIAGIMTDTNKIGYIAEYPLAGIPANINAFAIGAKMVNPEARIYLEWSTLKANKDVDLTDKFYNDGITYISHYDMILPQHTSRRYGLYRVNGETPVNIAFPAVDWGKYYERIIRNIRSGTWNADGKDTENKALNYWWGMSADVVSLVWSSAVPPETTQLLRTLCNSIRRYDLNPFSGVLHSQDKAVQTDSEHRMTPEEIIAIDWLADNVIGTIPSVGELQESAQNVVLTEGIHAKDLA